MNPSLISPLCWNWLWCVYELTTGMQPYIALLSTPQCNFTSWGNWYFRNGSSPASAGTYIEEELVYELPRALQGFIDFQSHGQAVALPLAPCAQTGWPLLEMTLPFNTYFLSSINHSEDYVFPW